MCTTHLSGHVTSCLFVELFDVILSPVGLCVANFFSLMDAFRCVKNSWSEIHISHLLHLLGKFFCATYIYSISIFRGGALKSNFLRVLIL